jgi:hypothetical protein
MAAGLAIAVLIFVLIRSYTPTTTAYVVNDTAETMTVDYCADSTVVVTPGEKQEITPFADPPRTYCNVFRGQGDLSNQVGCIYIPTPHGHVPAGVVVRISAMRPLMGRSGCR